MSLFTELYSASSKLNATRLLAEICTSWLRRQNCMASSYYDNVKHYVIFTQ